MRVAKRGVEKGPGLGRRRRSGDGINSFSCAPSSCMHGATVLFHGDLAVCMQLAEREKGVCERGYFEAAQNIAFSLLQAERICHPSCRRCQKLPLEKKGTGPWTAHQHTRFPEIIWTLSFLAISCIVIYRRREANLIWIALYFLFRGNSYPEIVPGKRDPSFALIQVKKNLFWN